ncbi:MAG: hypothetical protein IJH50_10385 [Kiritimatiellae bacterium]|nr:hypothetical protein [Kiritimatiellia bacterium]
MKNKTLWQICQQELAAVTAAAHNTDCDGFTAAIEFGHVNEGMRARSDVMLDRVAAELPVGGELAWKWTAAGDGVSLKATGLKHCAAFERAAIAEHVIDAICACAEEGGAR